MESTASLPILDELKAVPKTIPIKEETDVDVNEIPEGSPSIGEEHETQLTPADPDNSKEEPTKKNDDIQGDDTQEETNKKNEENHCDKSAEGETHENNTEFAAEKQEFPEEEKEKATEGVIPMESQILKLNGNHSLSIHDDENTCSSTTSSASSHNLVIDDPLAEKIPPPKRAVEEAHGLKVETKSLKRKLSTCENGSPQYKQIHLDTDGGSSPNSDADVRVGETMPEIKNEVPTVRVDLQESPSRVLNIELLPIKPPSEQYTASCSIAKEAPLQTKPASPSSYALYTTSESISTEAIAPQKPQSPGPFKHNDAGFRQIDKYTPPAKAPSPSPYEQYIQSSSTSLPTPKLSFDCFKCKNAKFDTFTELRDHHKVCYQRHKHRKLPPTPTVTAPCCTEKPAQPEKPPGPLSEAKKRFYLCSSCGTYHENWNLFLHIREIHNRHVCLYCIRLFPTAEKLSLHLEIKHDLEQNHFNSEELLRSVSKDDGNSRFLMCCTCQHVFSEHERFSEHVCTEYMQPCSLCCQKGRHSNNCKANPEKRPKVKKKSKAATTATVTKSNVQIPKTSFPTSVCDINSSSNNNQVVLSALPTLPHLPLDFAKQNGFSDQRPPSRVEAVSQDFHYNSDDSTNMVIDETCSSSNFITDMDGVNPFKALDERERLQQEVQKISETRPNLPPDRVPDAIPEPIPLIVPKIKLRVPKEFQKAVESEISSTDSDEDDEDVEEEDDEYKQTNSDIAADMNVTSHNCKDDDSDNNDGCTADEKENTQDWDESNSSLDRILKEIEKTKLDIQRTKELLEPLNILKRVPSRVETPPHFRNEPPTQKVEASNPSIELETAPPAPPSPAFSSSEFLNNLSNPTSCMESYKSENLPDGWRTPQIGMYSPTPQATPNSVWPSPLYPLEVSPAVLQAVSERENIENIEKESEQAKEQNSESEKMETSGDLDVESDHNREESTLDIEEKPCSPVQRMDFSPIVDVEPNIPTEEAEQEEAHQPRPLIEAKEDEDEEVEVVNEKLPPADGIEVANEDVLITDLLLNRPLERFETVEFVRLCVKAVYSLCLYCNHARRIAVNGHSLVLHLLAQHRFAATVDSITAEELLPSTIVSKLKSFLPDLEADYFNLESYCSIPPKERNIIACDERQFECFQCRFSTKMHKDLYLHNRKMHLKTAILCFMCRANFYSFSEILCHICPGMPNKMTMFDIKFRCCLCDVDQIPSPFRLMVHLRKKHFACDICLEDCREQGRLSSHVWKHKLHHLCYRCGIAYRNKMDITKHLFWKHGTESIICKRCLQKRWRHVYHFCVPPTSFVCETCNLCFSKATYLKVHKRVHTGDFRYPCTEDDCEEKFISRKLLLKHNAIHAPPEVKVEEKTNSEPDVKSEQENVVKEEEVVKEEQSVPEPIESKEEVPKSDDKNPEQTFEQTSKRKKKKNRNKESLEDLNLRAPNLSESDSSDESDVEKPKTDDKDSLVPNVMLSPPSDDDKDEEKEPNKPAEPADTDKIMNIWENFKTFQASQQPKPDEDDNESLTESNYPTPILHVASSDHDYCAMYKIRPRAAVDKQIEPERVDISSDTERNTNDSTRDKSISPTKKKRKSIGSGSSSSDSSSGSDSSCSCGSNCSCSSSGSSSSSSSSDEDSDSSTSEGRRRIAAKKEERAARNRWKSESSMKASISEVIDVVAEDKELIPVPTVKENLEPVLIETDLETAESDTDEEFYDQHPQRLASEMLAQKRDQLRAQMRLSPSHNFDIMENSRPSTPSLPEEMVKEKKVKLKKKKRDRKSTSKSLAVPPIKLNLSVNKVEISIKEPVVHQTSMQVPVVDLEPPYDLIASPGVAEPPVAHQPASAPILQNNTVKPVPFFHTRMSEGSSCSDADSSLKRSKRARRPNKFYGYTSDDENMPGTPLLIGTRTFKPQPPPQLTWRKEDLPAPSKSILLNKQPRSPRTSKTAAPSTGQLKKRVHQKSSSAKKKQHSKLPPIPTLKIRSKIGIVAPVLPLVLGPPPPPSANHTYSSSRDESDDTDSSDDDLELPANTAIPTWTPPVALPPPVVVDTSPPPPQRQASAFNQKIPPALLPNPDFATIQYFKRNNIRYPIRPPAGARQPRDGESVYCYCRCPYDEVSEMIACDGENCLIEWFHFECVGIMVAPQGKWFCAECRPKYSNELYPKL